MVGVKLNEVLIALLVIAGVLQALPAFHTIFVKGGVGRNGSTVAVSTSHDHIGYMCIPVHLCISIYKTC